MVGDDLRLKHYQTLDGSEWKAEGRIIKVPDSKISSTSTCLFHCVHLLSLSDHSTEFTMEMYKLDGRGTPSDERTNFVCEYVWNSISFDRFVHYPCAQLLLLIGECF